MTVFDLIERATVSLIPTEILLHALCYTSKKAYTYYHIHQHGEWTYMHAHGHGS